MLGLGKAVVMAWLGAAVILAPATAVAEVGSPGGASSGPLVAVMFDDGWLDQYRNALPVLVEYGIPATFAIQVETIGWDRGTPAARMSLSELRELEGLGMEIASHSITHPNLTEASPRSLRRELEDSMARLRTMGLPPVIFVYPYGEWNDTVAEYVEEAGYRGARTLDPVYTNVSDLEGEGRFRICGWSITNESAEDVRYILDSAGPDQLVVLVYHHVREDPRGEATTGAREFRAHMRLLREGGYRVVLLSDLLPASGSEGPSLDSVPTAATAVAAVVGAALAADELRRRSSGRRERVGGGGTRAGAGGR